MLDFLASFGAGILASVGLLGLVLLPAWLTFKVMPGPRPDLSLGSVSQGKSRRYLIGRWALGLALFALIAVTFYPSIEVLKARACRDAGDFELCMEGPQD